MTEHRILFKVKNQQTLPLSLNSLAIISLLKLTPLCNSILPLQIDFESLGHSPNCCLLELPSNSYIVSGKHNFPKLALKSPKPCMNKNNIVVFIRIKTNLDTVSRAKQKQFLFLSVICLMEL